MWLHQLIPVGHIGSDSLPDPFPDATTPAWLPEGVLACIIVDGLQSMPGKRAGVACFHVLGHKDDTMKAATEYRDNRLTWSEMHEHPVQSSIRW